MADTPVCKQCGAELKPGRRFCTQCQAPIPLDEPEVVEEPLFLAIQTKVRRYLSVQVVAAIVGIMLLTFFPILTIYDYYGSIDTQYSLRSGEEPIVRLGILVAIVGLLVALYAAIKTNQAMGYDGSQTDLRKKARSTIWGGGLTAVILGFFFILQLMDVNWILEPGFYGALIASVVIALLGKEISDSFARL